MVFLKGVDNVMMKKSIDFVLVKIKQITNEKSKLIVYGCFTKTSKMGRKSTLKLKHDMILAYLTEFSDMLFRKD